MKPRRAWGPTLLLLLSTAFAAACSQPKPTWTRLALLGHADAERGASGPTLPEGLALVRGEGARAIACPLPAAGFRQVAPGVFECAQPVLSIGRPSAELREYSLSFPDVPELELAHDGAALASGDGAAFLVEAGTLRVRVPGGALPGDARLVVAAAHQTVEDAARMVVSGRRVGGEGFSVWPGESVRVTCDVPFTSALRFGIAREAARVGPGARFDQQTVRVLLDGAPIDEWQLPRGYREVVEWREVALPRGGGRGVTFTFEVEGPFAYTSILDPVVGPAGPVEHGEQRDVVVFLADTFRADNLAAYGGTDGRAPTLDAFADTALLFRNAWSVSTHTLPTHSTLFSGMYPRQSGQVDFFHPLPRAVDTLAEHFARLGYRTVALTDGIMVSQSHGMAQGFSWFDERRTDLDGTLERVRAALGSDDGRPLFLFVQSYATHAPYDIRPSTRELLGDRFRAPADFDTLFAALGPMSGDSQVVDLEHPGAREALVGLATLYAAAVHDLDRGFAELWDLLMEDGLFQRGHLVVTSDHGESFGEHSRAFHAGVPFEEVLRVPLMIAGARARSGVVEQPVSLIDLPRTIADLAGVPAPSEWLGTSLLAAGEKAPVFAFQCRGSTAPTTVAVIEDGRKLIGLEDREAHAVSEWLHAFDLEQDPTEAVDLFGGDADWPRALGESASPRFVDYLTPRVTSEELELSEEERRRLEGAGYLGG